MKGPTKAKSSTVLSSIHIPHSLFLSNNKRVSKEAKVLMELLVRMAPVV